MPGDTSPDIANSSIPVAEEPPGMPTPTPDEAVAMKMAARMKKKVSLILATMAYGKYAIPTVA